MPNMMPKVLEVRRDLLASKSLDVHSLHDGFGGGVCFPELVYCLHEEAMEFLGPSDTRSWLREPLEESRGEGEGSRRLGHDYRH